MNSPWDEIIERRGTNSLKYDFAAQRGKPDDVLPLWVADMDFRTSPAVLSALKQAVEHGIFGYSESGQDYFEALQRWYRKNFNWSIQKEWLVKTPGIVFAIHAAVRALTEKGDAVLIQRPVYYPFTESIQNNGRVLINNPLVYSDGRYTIDFADFEQKIVDNRVKLFLLCSPHNPVGRVWSREELNRLGEICARHNVVVLSDEIHADFVYGGNRHTVFANLSPAFAQQCIVCTAPSKSFNLAGLQISNIFIPNRELREKFQAEVNRTGYSQLNGLGLVACQAAYEHGEEWQNELRGYLVSNLNFVRKFLKENIPQIKLVEPQGTYLVWLDCNALGLNSTELENLIVHRAKLWLDKGELFGPEGKGFERINIACPRATLENALTKLKAAVDERLS